MLKGKEMLMKRILLFFFSILLIGGTAIYCMEQKQEFKKKIRKSKSESVLNQLTDSPLENFRKKDRTTDILSDLENGDLETEESEEEEEGESSWYSDEEDDEIVAVEVAVDFAQEKGWAGILRRQNVEAICKQVLDGRRQYRRGFKKAYKKKVKIIKKRKRIKKGFGEDLGKFALDRVLLPVSTEFSKKFKDEFMNILTSNYEDLVRNNDTLEQDAQRLEGDKEELKDKSERLEKYLHAEKGWDLKNKACSLCTLCLAGTIWCTVTVLVATTPELVKGLFGNS